MADLKISELPAGTSAVGTAQLPVNEGGTTKRYTLAQVLAYIDGAITRTWATISGTPTTLAGYGITDAASDSELASHEADTTAIHGIADTAALVLTGDSRLTNARTPTSHAATHASAGSDPITIAESQVTSLVADLALKAPLASPTFTGTPAAPTPAVDNSTTLLATTAYVQGQKGTANPQAPGTAAPGTSAKWTPIDHVHPIIGSPAQIGVAVSDETTAITTGAGKLTFRMPYAMTLTSVRASLKTASSSGIPAINVKEGGVSIFSTTLTIDATEKTSQTAAVPAVISDPNLADDAEITVDIDTAGTGAVGLKLWLIGVRA